jgi:hypothetical protein
MHDLTTIQRMNQEAVAQKFNDWRDTIDLEVVRKWYLFIPGDGTPFNEIVDTYEGMRSLLLTHYVDPYDIITVPGEIDE